MSLKELFEFGGWAMWPLLIFSIAVIGIVMDRLVFIALHDLRSRNFFQKLFQEIQKGNVNTAFAMCQTSKRKKPCVNIYKAGLDVADLGEHRMERAMETQAAEEINKLESGFSLLVAVGSIAPITGFLGTVSGMIGAFSSIANATEVNAQLVAGGIFEALITTAFGLAIAIIAIIAYNIFSNIVDRFSADIEQTGSRFVTQMLVSQKESVMQ